MEEFANKKGFFQVKKFSSHIRSAQLPDWDVTLILDNLRSAHNAGNVFRIAEALQLKIIACGYTPAPPHPVLAKTAMECDKLVPCTTAVSAAEAISQLRKNGCRQILALEHMPGSREVWDLEELPMPLALVLGNEAHGVSPEALALCDQTVELPMLGEKASINVGNAAAAALYAMYAKYKQQLSLLQVKI
ncbi:MAG: RNA methyltransferase [Lentisphaerae bacterium]|nr:RNA methyltransferase [Lentisphaerota bacterium]